MKLTSLQKRTVDSATDEELRELLTQVYKSHNERILSKLSHAVSDAEAIDDYKMYEWAVPVVGEHCHYIDFDERDGWRANPWAPRGHLCPAAFSAWVRSVSLLDEAFSLLQEVFDPTANHPEPEEAA